MEENKEKLDIGDYMVGLDIGTTKISVMIGKKNQYEKLEILGTGRAVSNGVARGIVANIDKTVDSIKQAIEEAEQKSGLNIKEVFVGIAGQHIKSLQHRGQIVRDNVEIEIDNMNDLQKLYRVIEEKGGSKIKISINQKDKNYFFELKNKRKFDYETLKHLNKERYIKKINI